MVARLQRMYEENQTLLMHGSSFASGMEQHLSTAVTSWKRICTILPTAILQQSKRGIVPRLGWILAGSTNHPLLPQNDTKWAEM